MSTVDAVIVATLVASFATLVTVHLSLIYSLLVRRPRWRAAAALLVPPLAPYFGLRARMLVRVAIWIVAVIAYGVSLSAAL